MDEWAPTPPESRRRARLLDGTIVEYKDLRQGLIFQSISPNGTPIHPFEDEPDNEVWCLVIGEPHQQIEQGWQVELDTGPLAKLKTALS